MGILVAPSPGDLTQASGTVRTVQGDIAVAWRRDGDRFRCKVQTPAGLPVEIRAPAGTVLVKNPP